MRIEIGSSVVVVGYEGYGVARVVGFSTEGNWAQLGRVICGVDYYSIKRLRLVIPLVDSEPRIMERCCFCRAQTGYRADLPDRAPRQQVPLCAACAEAGHPIYAIPSRKAWGDLGRAQRWARGELFNWERNSTVWIRVRERMWIRARERARNWNSKLGGNNVG